MPRIDFRTPRLFIDSPLDPRATLELDRSQANYLTNVLRLGAGDRVLVFNGRDGEWAATISATKRPHLALTEQTRSQGRASDIRYVFAPLKHARLDYIAQKAVEMGATALLPVLTQHVIHNTKRIKVGPIGYVLPGWNPLRLALEIAWLDQLTKGRTLVGFLHPRAAHGVLTELEQDVERP